MQVDTFYEKRRKAFENLGEIQRANISILSNLRLMVFAIGIILTVVMYILKYYILLGAIFIAWIILFAYLVIKHHRLIENKKRVDALKSINEECLKRIKGEWKDFKDTGEEFKDPSHPFLEDIDIFGRGSLYQWINTARTFTGRRNLARILSQPLKKVNDIQERQQALMELAGKLSWRQRFMVESMRITEEPQNLEELYDWAGNVNEFYRRNWVITLLRLLPATTIVLGVLSIITTYVPWYFPIMGLVLQFLMLQNKAKKRGIIFAIAEKYKNSLCTYNEMLKTFEDAEFKSKIMLNLQKRLMDEEGNTAFQQVNRLVKLWQSISNRYNAFHIFFNVLTLWDYQCLIALEAWKERSGKNLRLWFDTMGEVEALASISLICCDHPNWVMPEVIETEKPVLEAKSMGHPLLGEERVCNDIKISRPEGILLITGSNMSGKSTFLRTAGLNLLLAYVGAPVCASEFQCSIMDIYTCMRTRDNLEQSVSSFYAELMRVKILINASREGKQIFFLLDEIFKGTNSKDRHTGAKVLIQKLREQGAIGMVSTHDLELAELEKESTNSVKNYHFKEYYRDDQIGFDYKLRSGVSDTRNAVYLMRMAGIEIDDET